MSKKRIVYLRLDSKEQVHLEIMSTEEEINKLIKILQLAYKFSHFNIIPVKDDE